MSILRRIKNILNNKYFSQNASKPYALLSPLEEQFVLEFESTYKVSLPDEYRDFILNTSAGHHYEHQYGIGHICNWIDGFELYDKDIPSDYLVTPFDPRHHLNDDSYPADSMRGSMQVCNLGCNNYIILIVSGPNRNEIWADSRYIGKGVYPIEGANGIMRFKEWAQSVISHEANHIYINDANWSQINEQ